MAMRDSFTWERIVHARYTIGGVGALIVGIGLTGWLAAWASSKEPPSGAQSLLLVVLAAVAQFASVALLSRGRPSSTSVRIAVRHLAEIGDNVVLAKQTAEAAQDNGSALVAKAAIGELSVRLSGIESQVASSIQDWVETHEIHSPQPQAMEVNDVG